MTADPQHQQNGLIIRDDRYHARCTCGWLSGGCRSGRSAGFRWNVHAAQVALDAQVAATAKR